MPSTKIVRRGARARLGRRNIGSRLVAATDGSAASDGALRLAGLLAERDHGEVEVVTVVEPTPVYVATVADVAVAEVDEGRRAAQARAIRDRLRAVVGEVSWSVATELGPAAASICRIAQRHRASLVMMGIGQHRTVDRLLGRETALHVVRQTAIPVLAVTPNATHLPERALVAVDFSESSLQAAAAALAVLSPTGEAALVHVCPLIEEATSPDRVRWGEVYEDGARQRLEAIAERLPRRPGQRLTTLLVHGDPGRAVVELAENTRRDLVAIGSHRQSAVERVMTGSVATRVVRGARCSVLVTPPVAGMRRLR